MKKVIDWLKESNRWKHLLAGIIIGLLANGWYCAELVGIGVACTCEFKDKSWGGKWDWIDLIITIVGVNIGYTIRYFLL
jgi:hypothetical protein